MLLCEIIAVYFTRWIWLSGIWRCVYTYTEPIITSLSTKPVTKTLLHKQIAFSGSLVSISPLQFSFCHFIEQSQNVKLQILSRPHTFWKYFSTHDGALIFAILTFLLSNVTFQLLQTMLIAHITSLSQCLPQIIIAHIKILRTTMLHLSDLFVYSLKNHGLCHFACAHCTPVSNFGSCNGTSWPEWWFS